MTPRLLKDLTERWPEVNRLADLRRTFSKIRGSSSTPCPHRAGPYNDERMPLMHEIRTDGIDF